MYLMKIKTESIMRYILINICRNSKKEYLFQAIMMLILLLSDKTVMNFSYRN